LLSSLVFGALHWPRLLSASFAGLVFGMIFLRYRSLVASILAHAAHNLAVTVGLSFTAFPFHKDVQHLDRLSNWRIEIMSLGIGILLLIYVALSLWPETRDIDVRVQE